ncbi:MAG: peptidase [Candidatus Latescibacteria bacterium]|nr:peptidase [Candidatus Latescibacterota bacterium]NIO27203.1 peptidase [Candidatus Latescibacterota bacterium]NIO54727.1 peptidase [Candidatus Latescibacterota bacterium]NIT00810.1 peptidase [Candidatus Latescibacterota bacterium]NIT37733.1 peptidase [Candidatus Latescibacterota bacterium]
MKRFLTVILIGFALVGCASKAKIQQEAQAFLDAYTAEYKALAYAADKADWKSNTMIIEGDTTNAYATRKAKEALAAFTGSSANIEAAQEFLGRRNKLTPLQVRQLEKILYMAANNPQTVPDLVEARIKAETEQTEKLYGFDFKINGASISTNDIDQILKTETQLPRRLEAWRASKEVGASLKDGLVNLQRLRNETVRALGYNDYCSYQVSDYGMETQELLDLMLQLNRELRPLYREIHTYARYELAKRYGVEEVPDMLPAHWLPNRWGQDWTSMITVEGFDLDGALQDKTAKWLLEQAERFYISLGFPELPGTFWEWSSLYPLPPDAGYKKNNHASAWHLDLDKDVRCLMSVVPSSEWYETTHHELGHIYYYMSYSNPDVPILLRQGANRAFHEAIGSLLGLASMQKPFIAHLGLLPTEAQAHELQSLLKEALNYVVFIPWSAGVMTEFEYELYAKELPRDQFNKRWWELKSKYQGIVPPSPRGEEHCDPASKTHITDDPAQYYDYALSYVILFQLHDHIARNILRQDPHATNYYGDKELGKFLRDLLYPGGTRDWRELLRETTGEDLSANAMLRYFEPLMAYLKKANEGRKHTLPDV